MQFIKEILRSNIVGSDMGKQTVLLLLGAFSVALLTEIGAGLFGEVAAMLALLLFSVTLAAMRDYRYGILIAIILLPLSPTYLFPKEMFGVTGFNPLNVTLAFSTCVLGFTRLVFPGKIVIPKFPLRFWLYIAILALATIQGAFHVSSIPAYFRELQIINFDTVGGYVVDIFLKPMIILIVAYLLSVVVNNAQRPVLYLIPIFFSSVMLPVSVIVYVMNSGIPLSALASSDARDFLSVTGMHANELGLMFNMAFALAIFCFFGTSSTLVKVMLGITSVILMGAIMLTFSRGAYVGLLAVGGFVLFTHRRFGTMFLVLLLVAVAAFFMPEAVTERASTGLASGSVEDISAGRVDGIWLPLLPEAVSSPIIGHGLDSILWSESAQQRTILAVGHTHSAYLGAVLNFGCLGSLIIFLFFRHMWNVFGDLAKHMPEAIWRAFFRGAMACILLLLVQGLTDDSFTPNRTQPFLWLAYGIAMGLIARKHSQSVPPLPGLLA